MCVCVVLWVTRVEGGACAHQTLPLLSVVRVEVVLSSEKREATHTHTGVYVCVCVWSRFFTIKRKANPVRDQSKSHTALGGASRDQQHRTTAVPKRSPHPSTHSSTHPLLPVAAICACVCVRVSNVYV